MSTEYDDDFDYVGPPLTDDEVNAVLIDLEEHDEGNWRTDANGRRYYVGPRFAGDGTIDWHGDGWPE